MQPNARGMAFNADMVCLIQFLNMGTQAAPGIALNVPPPTRAPRLRAAEESPGAIGIPGRLPVDAEHAVAAIADGVSSAIFSGPWADILVQAVLGDAPDPGQPEPFAAWLQTQRGLWAAGIDTRSLAWFQRAKLPAGAFSTLLWIRLQEAEQAAPGSFGAYRLRAWAIGDSCLFHVRRGELVRTFPLSTSAELESDPIVLGSVDLKRDQLLRFASLDAFCYPDDLLVLSTDALAEWALAEYEAARPPDWERYWNMSDEEWRAQIDALRQERQHARRRHDAGAVGRGRPAGDRRARAASGWICAASEDVKAVSARVVEEVDQTSVQVLRGLKAFKQGRCGNTARSSARRSE